MEPPTGSGEVAGSSNKADAALGYRYWTGKPGDGVEAPAPKPVPKKLSQEELAQTAQAGPSSGGSAWNKAGTWEERNLTAWGKDRLGELLKELDEISFPEGRARVTEMSSCTGDATQFFVRGKRRCGYHFEIDLKWKGTFKEEEVTGMLKIPEAAFGELDEVTVETTFDSSKVLTTDSKVSIRTAFSALVPAIVERLSIFEEELKER
ncbi:hypothetical protein KFL_002610140 [Klebsormidium nitens]|uniref:Activator of Hsp90 ATPase AHSA1-like N-terminal domain-containing protein n=1 Tax=Klebsormidium nitens TaxID=105231 RepID=A0A1Y1ICW9_KLENI|nr:hypothetical protein KFL_002610140 [Klebsormidium nitens]|eukprot:GAQ85928.1 hypothetical protein KFL_002610140 [Klebsormidium nitens]